MDEVHFYHMYANGDDAKNFITSEEEFKSAFNRFAVCQHATGAVVISFSIEESHPHALLWGTYETCYRFEQLYRSISIRSITRNRGSSDGVVLNFELAEVSDPSYLRNVGTYTIVQPTKDGKAVMPYDYKYGTCALYFRSSNAVLPWLIDDDGNVHAPVRFDSLPTRDRKKICGSTLMVPDNWMVCNGFILPDNYIDIRRFEGIYQTHNCFRVFLCRGRKSDEEIIRHMAQVRGVSLDDFQARRICEENCLELFGKKTARYADASQRIILARRLRSSFSLSLRQISGLTHIPESELRKYIT